jgi:hypothetical protein
VRSLGWSGGVSVQPHGVGETEAQVLGVRDGLGKERADVIIVQRIDDPSASTLAQDEPEVSQDAQLLGDRGLLHPDVLREDRDRACPGTETTEDAHPARNRQCLHRLRDHPRIVFGQERRPGVTLAAQEHIIS